MKILQINKFFFVNGGSSRCFFEVSKALRLYGHKVAYFSMINPNKQNSEWSKYFVSIITYEKLDIRRLPSILVRMFYSFEARKKISRLLDEFKPDIAHSHNIYHHISPSIIFEIKRRKIPIIQTLHDYHLIAPNYNLFHDNKICEITKPNIFYKALFHKCVKNSYFFSLAEVIEKYFHHWLGWERNYIDYFIAPSMFMRKKLIEYGLPKEKIIHLPHFIDSTKYKPNYEIGNYILYFGRLSPEKGIKYLIQVMKLLPKIKLIIAGRGSQEQELRMMNQELGNKNVEFVGFQEGARLKKLIAGSRFTILPSVWFENSPNSILESYACGKPVLGSRIGGIPEILHNMVNGIFFEPGNEDDLADKIDTLWNNPALCKKLGKNAREYVEKNFGPEEHYECLMDIYKKAINLHK